MILRKGMEKSLLDLKPVSSRLMKAGLRGRHTDIRLIQCYAPTNKREEADKDAFHQQLQAEEDAAPRHDLTNVMEDLDVKVGSDNLNCDRATRKHRCDTGNENAQRLIDVCNMNNLVIGGTNFPHIKTTTS